MILIFGGTTEGRLAIDVCEEAGKPYYYSTKGSRQDVEMHKGVRLCGAMSVDEMKDFCLSHSIRTIIDAAHPFAEMLHESISRVSRDIDIPVIRIQRTVDSHRNDVVYCRDFSDAINRMQADGVHSLLALSGVNTISKLKPFWKNHKTIFRILDRKESVDIATDCGFPTENLIYYSDTHHLPTVNEEKSLMQRLRPDAMITKESGESGGYEAKVEAAISLGVRVYVVQSPCVSNDWHIVTGRYGLRRAIEDIAPEFFPLKTGLTTGACATAAVKAALISLLSDEYPEEVSFALPDGEVMTIATECETKGRATVVKPGNDDPDVTRGCRVSATVSLSEVNTCDKPKVRFLQGEGVGRVTLPGLGLPVGEPAINPTPRRMIENEVAGLTDACVDVTISIENGRELAQKTFNSRVGVVDGLSIIGTSGIVKPLSNEAFVESIRREMQVAKAVGCREIGLVSGMKGERMLTKEKQMRCIHYGNFIGEALKATHSVGISNVTLAIMIGKAVKLAEGHLDTHSHKVQMNKTFLSSLAPEYSDKIESITMARELWTFMPDSFFEKIKELCMTNCRKVFPDGEIKILLLCDDKR